MHYSVQIQPALDLVLNSKRLVLSLFYVQPPSTWAEGKKAMQNSFLFDTTSGEANNAKQRKRCSRSSASSGIMAKT